MPESSEPCTGARKTTVGENRFAKRVENFRVDSSNLFLLDLLYYERHRMWPPDRRRCRCGKEVSIAQKKKKDVRVCMACREMIVNRGHRLRYTPMPHPIFELVHDTTVDPPVFRRGRRLRS